MSGSRVFGPGPTIVGHRGCGKGTVAGQPENTIGSFLAAVDLGVGWVEVDARRTSDDRLVVAHNPADEGVFYADITGADAVARGALRLEELLEALPPHIGVDLDLKTAMEDATRERRLTTAAVLAPVAAREAARRPTLVTTFDPGALTIVTELAPGVPRGLLTWLDFPIGQAVAAAGHLDVQVLAANWGSLRPNAVEPESMQRPLKYVVDVVHRSGRELLAWCPPHRFAHQLIDADIDAVCVDEVPTFQHAVARGARPSQPANS
jgi:glycerophosphoryl diester phosphodiesterase